ncbi:hypothetical protein [Lichenicoccus sp.]|uniref:chorismate transformation enzyme, FkbO/Hyg5 family n=1 Tax=Lichenicoccus sp. TaxID=2781899 RepID=UPI003D0E32A8
MSVAYLDDAAPLHDPDHVLGVVALAGHAAADLAVGLPGLDRPGVREVWRSETVVRRESRPDMRLATTEGYCFGMIRQPVPAPGAARKPLSDAAQAAYARMLAASREAGCPNLLRIANFVPHITRIEAGEERYRSFNAGRQQAFASFGYDAVQAPAACGLGCTGDALLVWFLAGREPGRNIDNPRQVSPRLYPERYGVRRPAFARATIAAGLLMVSGTASIVGHASLHAGDVLRQTDETIRNLDALLAGAGGGLGRDALALKVYLRHASDRDAVARRLAGAGFAPPAAILQSEICRPELDIEIEAHATFAGQIDER